MGALNIIGSLAYDARFFLCVLMYRRVFRWSVMLYCGVLDCKELAVVAHLLGESLAYILWMIAVGKEGSALAGLCTALLDFFLLFHYGAIMV